jgi:hypothetical protein
VAKVVTISVKDTDLNIWRAFVELAKREGRSASEMVMEYVRSYVERHSQNPVTPLDKWIENPQLTLFPTLGEPPTWKKLKEFPKDKLMELMVNAKAYYEMTDQLLKYLTLHERDHKPLGYKDIYCPFCEDGL